jgi:hypothetical protein
MRITVVFAALLGALLLVSCGGGDEEAAAPTATSEAEVAPADLTPVDLTPVETPVTLSAADAALAARLPDVILTEDDMPSGFTLSRSREVPNELVAAGDPLPEQRQRELEETGRLTGYQVVFERGQGALSITLSLYETAEGAQESVEMDLRFPPGVNSEQVDAPDIGVPAAAWDIEEMTSGLQGYVVVAAQGRIAVGLSYGDVGAPDREEVDGLLRAQVEKLGDLE